VEVAVAEYDINVRLETKDPNLRKMFEAIIGSVEGLSLQSPDNAGRADLLIFELGAERDKELQMVNSLLNAGEVSEVFFTAHDSDPRMLLRAIQIGAREFFPQPITDEEVRGALERFKKRWKPPVEEEPEPGKIGQIIHVIGSKGGTGTTTVAVNLAVSLAEHQSAPSVALVDMNLLFGEIPLFMGIQPSHHWGEITKNISRLDQTFLKNVLSVGSSKVYVLPSPSYLDRQILATPEIMERLLKTMRRGFDFVIVDGGQSLDSIALKILEMSDTVLVVSILSVPCLSNTGKLLRSFDNLGHPPRQRVKVIINRFLKDSDISIEDAEKAIGHKIFWNILNDYPSTISAINKGEPLSQLAPRAQISKNFKALADTLIQTEAPSEEKAEKKGKKWWKR
jgi:pilus assembly protein CpaE